MDKICSSHQSAFLFAYFKLMHQVNGAGQFLCRFFLIHSSTSKHWLMWVWRVLCAAVRQNLISIPLKSFDRR